MTKRKVHMFLEIQEIHENEDVIAIAYCGKTSDELDSMESDLSKINCKNCLDAIIIKLNHNPEYIKQCRKW